MTPLITLGVMACILLTGRFLLSWQRPDQVDLAGKIRRKNGMDFGSLDEEPEKTTFLAKKEKELLQSGTGITHVKALKRMASSLRTGSTLLQAVEDVVHTHALPRVIREELAAVLLDFEYHDTFEEAFKKMYERTGSEDVKSTALSIQISTKYGAKLASVSATVTIVSLVPFLFGFLVRYSDPTYFDGLYAFGGGLGRWVLLVLYGIDVFGYFFLKSKCNIRI